MSPVEHFIFLCHTESTNQAFKDELLCWHYSKRGNTNVTACETTLLYQLVEQYYPAFEEALAAQDKRLPKYVEREFDDFLRCGRLEHGFMRVVCGDCITLQTLPASSNGEYGQLANTSGFSLHAATSCREISANADEPDKLERLCRHISRPAISEPRLSMTQHGQVRYELKTPYRDGTTGDRRAMYSSRQSISLAN